MVWKLIVNKMLKYVKKIITYYLRILQMLATPFSTEEGDDIMRDQTPLQMINLIDPVVFIVCNFSK